ncbi:MAG: hypothetical protein LH702_28115 [Phormidesmis sp. CAN_BIN44]|nr:hypothetical protein [Phormidesmis sp. CAN_BIN44]
MRIAFWGWKIVFLIRMEPGLANSNSAAPARTPVQRFVVAHLVWKLGSSGQLLVAATNCARHSATPIV